MNDLLWQTCHWEDYGQSTPRIIRSTLIKSKWQANALILFALSHSPARFGQSVESSPIGNEVQNSRGFRVSNWWSDDGLPVELLASPGRRIIEEEDRVHTLWHSQPLRLRSNSVDCFHKAEEKIFRCFFLAPLQGKGVLSKEVPQALARQVVQVVLGLFRSQIQFCNCVPYAFV
jgi:hypothetical protein